jgi:mono/diheme cytochrome c family protein
MIFGSSSSLHLAELSVRAQGANGSAAGEVLYRTAERSPGTNPPIARSIAGPDGVTREQVVHGDRVFHGEAAGGQCHACHGQDARGTPNGSGPYNGHVSLGDRSVMSIKRMITHNMPILPGMDGGLRPEDVDAVADYVRALGRHNNR